MTHQVFSLAGRRALVTGAQQGIGKSVSLALAAAGADVAVNWLDDEVGARSVAEAISAMGRQSALVQGSVAEKSGADRIVSNAYDELGGLDILVNNAGVFPRSEFLDLDEAEWDHVLDVHLKGSFLVAQAAARRMIADGTQGRIVNISSAFVRGHVLGVHYATAKAGVVGLTRSMALALAPHKIRVNAVAPGTTDTAQTRQQYSEDELGLLSDLVPTGAMAQPEDIADVILFLCTDASRLMTGEVVQVNGGVYMG